MIFIAWVIAAILYLLVVSVVFSALIAYWERRMDRKAESARLREHVAARELRRYHHLPEHTCGLKGDAPDIDRRCVVWTLKVERFALERRRTKVRAALHRLAELKKVEEQRKAANSSMN